MLRIAYVSVWVCAAHERASGYFFIFARIPCPQSAHASLEQYLALLSLSSSNKTISKLRHWSFTVVKGIADPMFTLLHVGSNPYDFLSKEDILKDFYFPVHFIQWELRVSCFKMV